MPTKRPLNSPKPYDKRVPIIMINYEKLVQTLTNNGVQFVLIGGFAAVVHGASQLTEDLDVCIPFTVGNCRALLKGLGELHPKHRVPNRNLLDETPESLAKFKNLYLVTDLGPIDFLGTVAKLGPYEKVLEHTIEIELFGQKVKILDIESLIISKKEMARPKDKEAIFQLKAIQEKLKNKFSAT